MHEWTPETTDTALLRQYSGSGAEDAFEELVRRRLPMVYATILRRLGPDPSAAEDVAQSVFIEMARQARNLANHPALAGWLHTTASRMAMDHSRRQLRRQLREQTLMQPEAASPTTDVEWGKLKPVLDDALLQLPEADRHAVILRFLDQRDFNSIGAELGLSPDAARMRVSRSLEKLRSSLAARGILAGGVMLETLLDQRATVAVPTGLAATIRAAVGRLPTATVSSPAAAWTTRKLVLAAVVGLVGGGGTLMVGLHHHRQQASHASAVDPQAREANARTNLRSRPRWMPRAQTARETPPSIAPLVSEALGYLRAALFDTHLGKDVRIRLLEQCAGMLVGHEAEVIPLFREAFRSSNHETVAMAIEGIARFGKTIPREFAGELMALLENPDFAGEAGLIANRLVPSMAEGDSPVAGLLELLHRRPDLHGQVEYLLQAAIGFRPRSLAENHELLEALARETTGTVQASVLKILAEIPPAPTPPAPELARKIVDQLQSPTGKSRWDGLMAIHKLAGSSPEIRRTLAEMMADDPLPANRIEARLALMQKAPDDPALATLPEPGTGEPPDELRGRLDRNDVPVAEMFDALVDRPEDAPVVTRAIAQVSESYWMEHVDEKIQAVSILSSLHRYPDARVYQAAADTLGAFNHAPRQYYTVEELQPFFAAMESSLTPGEYAIAIRDNDFEGTWKSNGYIQPEPIHLRTGQVQTLLVGPSFQNPAAYEQMLKAMKAIDPGFEPPAP